MAEQQTYTNRATAIKEMSVDAIMAIKAGVNVRDDSYTERTRRGLEGSNIQELKEVANQHLSNSKLLGLEYQYQESEDKFQSYKKDLIGKYKEAPGVALGANPDSIPDNSIVLGGRYVQVSPEEKQKFNQLQGVSVANIDKLLKSVDEETTKLSPELGKTEQVFVRNAFLKSDDHIEGQKDKAQEFNAGVFVKAPSLIENVETAKMQPSATR